MAAEVAPNSLEEEALKRREKLKALRKKCGMTEEEGVGNLNPLIAVFLCAKS